MKKFYNSKEINEKNLIELITECSKSKWKNSDLFEETEIACEIIAFEEDYEGRKEDIEYILEKLKDGATLFDVENAIANGNWYFMETETWRKRSKIKKQEVINMKKNLGVIIGKRDATEGTIYYTEICDYLVLEEGEKFVVEGLLRGLKKPIDFIPEGHDSFVVGYFDNEEDVFKGITDFEKSQWG